MSENEIKEMLETVEALRNERKILKEGIEGLINLVHATPELNMSNYDEDQVEQLNDSMLEVWEMLLDLDNSFKNRVNSKNKNLNSENFWDTDLEDIEATFLPEGKKITDLPMLQNNLELGMGEEYEASNN